MQGETSKPLYPSNENLKMPMGIGPKQELDRICTSEYSRESAKGILARKIDQVVKELDGLKRLYESLPDAMAPGAEEALYKLIQAALPNQRFS